MQKWTGSKSLGERFNDEVLSNPKSFTRRDFGPLLSQYQDLLINLRTSTPNLTGSATPSESRRGSHRPSTQMQTQQEAPQAYWNEYDDGSEAGDNAPYMISVDPDTGFFPGAKTFAYIFKQTKKPMEKVKIWLSPTSSPGEQRPLLVSANESYFNEQQSVGDTDVDDETYASSSEFPTGYATHYATFPSVSDQKLSRHREDLLRYSMIGCFAASLLLLLIAGVLVFTGKHKLRVEVDAGVIVGVISSLFFATIGLSTIFYRQEKLGWIHRACVGVTFFSVCFLNVMLLFMVEQSTGL